MKSIAVLKFGGSSLSNSQKLENAVLKTKNFLKFYSKLIIVLSAPSDITDDLIKISSRFGPDDKTLEKLLTVGEQISIYLFEMASKKHRLNALSLNHYQLNIRINDNKEIYHINTLLIREKLKSFDIIVIPGFIGIDDNTNPTTLPRGGSDYTAVYLSKKLNAECYFLSDIKGVYSSNPLKIDNAKKLKEISYTEMLEISKFDSQIRQTKAMEYACKNKLEIFLGSTFENSRPTLITYRKNKKSEIRYISVNSKDDETDITLVAENISRRKDIIEKIKKFKILSFDLNTHSITIHFPKLNIEEIKKIYSRFILR
jgi:aspartate kinase